MWSVVCAEISDQSIVEAKILEYKNKFVFAKVSDIDEYISQTFGGTITAVGKASLLALSVSLIITALVTLLFMKMLVVKDRYSIAIMKALGFTSWDIAMQYLTRSGFVLLSGIVIGTLLANTLGETLASMAISFFGAVSFEFVVAPISTYLIYPLLMVGSMLIATTLSTANIKQIKISKSIKE